jgi:hypothetical protein
MDTNREREWARNGKTDQPQMDQPSREAMAGKLQIYADREADNSQEDHKAATG